VTTGTKHDLAEIVTHFALQGEFLDAAPYGSGHINDTYASRLQTPSGLVRYIQQRINHNVFKHPELLMANIERVTAYARERIIAAGGDPDRETLTLLPTVDGGSFYRSPEGNYWRTYIFIEGALTYDQPQNVGQVYSAAKAFGQFQKLLSTLPGKRLNETIPNFHHTRRRFDNFIRALEADAVNRAASAAAEIDFVLQREAETSVLVDMLGRGELPERVTHNDTKINNVMIDDITGEGVCVIDLDTVMPGSALYDFGDSVRTGAAAAAEDELDLSKVGLSLGLFEHLAHGYLDAARDFLTPSEIDYMPFSARLMTLECGIRFLADYLDGDIYFKIHRERHNLDRARTQFAMVEDMERKCEQMSAIVQRYR
jgi:Ser/Thr protein kinase RdoA (MazF antagonist)